jgi:hypothetical protein
MAYSTGLVPLTLWGLRCREDVTIRAEDHDYAVFNRATLGGREQNVGCRALSTTFTVRYQDQYADVTHNHQSLSLDSCFDDDES